MLGVLTIVAVGLAGVAGCAGQEPTAAPPAPATPTVLAKAPPLLSIAQHPSPAPDFALYNQYGERVSLASLRGRPVLLTFLYTHCTTTCPLYVAWIHSALYSLGANTGEVSVVAVTVDPERDTVERLREYTTQAGWPPDWLFLTGPPEEVDRVLTSFRIAVSKREPPPEMKQMGHEGYEVAHRAVVILIDAEGYMFAVLRGTYWTPQELITRLEPVLSGE
ncbi:MAG: SCO family protein [Ardenticatenaceae bacterium]|nr:SCO family protein [Ardenticatenaceae bacterium]